MSFISALPPISTVHYDFEETNDFNNSGTLVFTADDHKVGDSARVNDLPLVQINKESSGSKNGARKIFNSLKLSTSVDSKADQAKDHLPDYIKENWKLVLAMRSILGTN